MQTFPNCLEKRSWDFRIFFDSNQIISTKIEICRYGGGSNCAPNRFPSHVLKNTAKNQVESEFFWIA